MQRRSCHFLAARPIASLGPTGIGKSRLLAEFHRQLARGRVTWVEGRCVSYGTAIPYWLLLDLLRSNCGIVETDTPEAIIEKVRSGLQEVGMDPEQDSPVLLHLLGVREIDGSPALSNPEAVKAKAFEVFRQLSIKGSRSRPLVLVLEDLHWVDKISEEFLGFLAENAPDARILMLATYRPGIPSPVDRQVLCRADATATVIARRQPSNGSLGAQRRAPRRPGEPRKSSPRPTATRFSSSSWRCMRAKQRIFART